MLQQLIARHSHSLDVWKDKLVVFGGITADMDALDSLTILHVQVTQIYFLFVFLAVFLMIIGKYYYIVF